MAPTIIIKPTDPIPASSGPSVMTHASFEITFQGIAEGKEIEMRGSFRFHEEFALAVDLMNTGRVDLRPVISETRPVDDAVAAFELASDRRRSMKVQLDFA